MRMANRAVVALLACSVLLAACSSDDDDPVPVDLSGNYIVTDLSIADVDQVVLGGEGEFTSDDYDIAIQIATGETTSVTATSTGAYEAWDDGSFTQDGTFDADGPDGPTPPTAVQCTGSWVGDEDTGVLEIVANCTGGLVIETTLVDVDFVPVARTPAR